MSKIQKWLSYTNLYLYVEKNYVKLGLYTECLETMSKKKRKVTYEVHYAYTYIKNAQIQLCTLWICKYMFSL
jgi:hypothetical protein